MKLFYCVPKIHKNCFINEKLKQFSINLFLSLTLALVLHLDPQCLFFFPLLFLSLIPLDGKASIWVEALLLPNSQNLKKSSDVNLKVKKNIASFFKAFFFPKL